MWPRYSIRGYAKTHFFLRQQIIVASEKSEKLFANGRGDFLPKCYIPECRRRILGRNDEGALGKYHS